MHASLDRSVAYWLDWHKARHASLVLCRVQQRLESRMMVNTGIPVLTEEKLSVAAKQLKDLDVQPKTGEQRYAIACEAEVLAMTEALKLQDALPDMVATSLAGVMAKLEMIIGADRDIGDTTDFPWPHIASVLRDLRAIAGELPSYQADRLTTRSDVARHWEAAERLVTAMDRKGSLERRKLPA